MSESKLVVTIDGSQAESSARRLEGELGKLERAGTQAADSVGKVGDQSEQSVSKMDRLKGVVGSLGPMLGALAAAGITRAFVSIATETDRLRGQLETMTGSADKAGIAFKALEGFAARTPYSVDQAVEAFVKLKALGLDPSERSLTSFGNTAAAMGKSLTQMIEAVADASTGEFERLKEFGIKAKQQGDTVTMTFQGVTTTISNNAAEIQKYLVGLGETKFGDAMSNQMEKLPGLFSNLQDEVVGIFRAFGDAGGNAVITKVLKTLIAIADVTGKAIPIAMGYLRSAALSVFGAIDESVTRLKYNTQILAQQFKKLWDPEAAGRIEALTDARDAEIASIRQMTAELKEEAVNAGYAADSTADLTDAVDQNTDATDRNIGKIKELTAAQKERREDEMMAIMLKRESDLGLNETTDAIERQTDALRDQKAELDPWAESVKGATERVDEAFVDIWRNIGSGFDSFADSLKSAFSQLLAELAHMAITRPIVMRIGAALGLGGASAAASAANGASGLGSLGSLFGGLGGMSGKLGLAKLGMQGVGAQFGFTGPTGLAVGAGLNLGAGFAGGYAGNWAGEKLFGSEGYTGYGSTIGGVAGAIFGAGNPLATLLGSALGGIVDSAIGKLVGEKQPKWGALGVTTGTGYNSIVDTMTGASGLTLSAIANRTDEGAARELLQGFADLDGSLTALAAAMGVTVNLSGKTLGGRSLRVDGQGVGDAFGVAGRLDKLDTSTLKDAPAQFVRAWLDATADSFDEQIRPFLARIGGTAEEMLTQFGQIAQIQGIYKQSTDTLKALLETDTIGAVRQQIEDANRSLFDLWAQQGDAIVKFSTELADAEDYAQLTAMVQSRYQTEIALIAQVMGALQEISGIFDGTIEQIRLDQMSGPAEQYDYYKSQIDTLAGGIGTMTDPAAILDALKQIDQLAGKSYGLLDEQQKKTIGQDIIDYLDGVEAAAQERLNAILGMVGADKANEPGTVTNAITGAINGANDKMLAQLEKVFADGAAKQQKAADDLAAAAGQFGQWVVDLPGSINVTFAAPEVNA